ncbi:AGE family epimerase/isomerase [Asaia astilbis]
MNDLLSPMLLPETSWVRRAAHRHWLAAQGRRLLRFAQASRMEGGFGALGRDGKLPANAEADGILTARMVHSFAMAALQGIPGCLPLVNHGVKALLGPLHDKQHGGWYEAASDPGARKQAYLHAFVALAGSSAKLLSVEGGEKLMSLATEILETRYWSEEEGVMRESFAADWSDEEDYRGANANMHSTEACLALADITGNDEWLNRAHLIVHRFVHEIAGSHDHCMPEHFDRNWTLLRDYNKDNPTDSLRPYGMTPGHFSEWAHLTLKVEAALLRREGIAPSWMLQDARALLDSALRYGWAPDGKPGMVYTIDWDHKPHVTVRAHWVQAETVTAAVNLLKRTGSPAYESWYRKVWDYIAEALIDNDQGGWLNEVDAEGRVSEEVYPDKADLYHAFQATVAPILPLSPCLTLALRESDIV